MKAYYSYSEILEGKSFKTEKRVFHFRIEKRYFVLSYEKENENRVLYLLPSKGNKCLLLAFIPQIEVLDNYSELMSLSEFSGHSEKLNYLIKNSESKSVKHPFIAKVKDFTHNSENRNSSCWCICQIIPCQLSPDILQDCSMENDLLDMGLDVVEDSTNEFYNVFEEIISNVSSKNWTKSISKQFVAQTFAQMAKRKLYPEFIGKRINDNKTIDSPREILEIKKVILESASGNIYPIGKRIPKAESSGTAILYIKGEVFEDSLADYIFTIELYFNGSDWTPRIEMGEMNEFITKILKNTDSKKYGKISKSEYKKMPETCSLWFYTNPYHVDIDIKKFVDDGEIGPHFDGDSPYEKVEGNYIVSNSWKHLNSDNIWYNLNECIYVLQKGLVVMNEFTNYIPFFYKASTFDILKTIGSFALNPWKASYKWIKNKFN